ncbi:cysteine hydrolase [Patescibacteria group bacterium]|nr:cysteine hydrolase [Patescibacteria group bacterium]
MNLPEVPGPKVEQPFNPENYSLKEILKPQHSALVVVDMQNDFLDPKGFFARLNRPISQMQSTIPHIQGLIEVARSANVPIIFTKGYEDVKFRKGPDLRRAVKWDEADGDGSVNSQSGTWGAEFYKGIKPQEGDIIVEKHKWSAFDGKDKEGKNLKQILEKRGIKTLVITGVVAETCVETTIRNAYDQDYFVVVPRNSVGSNYPKQLQARMKYLEKGFIGDVVNEDEIKNYWPPVKETPTEIK